MIRVAPDLYRRIEKEAREQKRSVSSQASYIIERAMLAESAEAAR
jgi:hypothetical protein